ncbi:hypothetical protein [Bacteroides sp.]
MKYKNNIKVGLFALVAVIMASCDKDNKSSIYNADNTGVTFATGSQSVALPSSGVTSFDVEIIRAQYSEAATVPLVLKDTTKLGLFTAPANISFEAGKDKATVTVQVGNIISGITYAITLSLPENETALGGTQSRKIIIEKDYTYSSLGNGYIESTSMADEGEEYATWDVEIQKADQATWYKAIDLFEEGKNIIIKVDQNNKVTVDKQAAWTDPGYGTVSVSGKGKLDALTGVMTLKLEHTVSAGSFGEYTEIIHLP